MITLSYFWPLLKRFRAIKNWLKPKTKSSWANLSTWRTLAYQEVRFRIGPLAKLGRLKSTAENYPVYIVTISSSSGPIQSLTSWYAKVLHAMTRRGSTSWCRCKQTTKKFTAYKTTSVWGWFPNIGCLFEEWKINKNLFE